MIWLLLLKKRRISVKRLQQVLRRAEEYELEREYLGRRIKYGMIQPSKLNTEAVLKMS